MARQTVRQVPKVSVEMAPLLQISARTDNRILICQVDTSAALAAAAVELAPLRQLKPAETDYVKPYTI
jgi:hypothetical protein